MRRYTLKSDKPTTDAHGQPLQFFRARFDNNVSKAIDQLSGICAGILADGTVNEAEARFFADWVKKYTSFEPVWPFADILIRIERIFEDGQCDEEERVELKEIMEAICGHTHEAKPSENYSSKLPIDDPLPSPLAFTNKQYAITGRFAFGTRKKVFDVISSLGAEPSGSMPSQFTNYLVIGAFASRDWYNTNFGRKIERAVELREEGSGISIISEEHWVKFLTRSETEG